MKNAKKALALLLSVIMVVSCLTGMVFTAAAEEKTVEGATYVLDFTKISNDPAADYQITKVQGSTLSPCTNGYLTVTVDDNGKDPYLEFGNTESELYSYNAADMAYVVVKYRTNTTMNGLTIMTGDSYEWFKTVDVVADSNWHVTMIDAGWTQYFEKNFGGKLNTFRVDPMDTTANDAVYAGQQMDIAYIAFFATEEAAVAAMNAEVVSTETVAGTVSADSLLFEINGKNYIAMDAVEADEENYTFDGFRVLKNGKDTGKVIRTATNGLKYFTSGGMVEVVEISAADAGVEYEGKTYTYENKIDLRPLYQVGAGVGHSYEVKAPRGIVDDIYATYAGDTEPTLLLKNGAGNTIIKNSKKLVISNAGKEVNSISFQAWIDTSAKADGNGGQGITGAVTAVGAIINGEYVTDEAWCVYDAELTGNAYCESASYANVSIDVSDWAPGTYFISLAFEANDKVYANDWCNYLTFIKYASEGENISILVDEAGKSYVTDDKGIVAMKDGIYGYFTGVHNVDNEVTINGKTYAYASETVLKKNYINNVVPDNLPVSNTVMVPCGQTTCEGPIYRDSFADENVIIPNPYNEILLRSWLIDGVVVDKYGEYENLCFDGWIGGNPIGAGYQIGNAEPVFDDSFLVKDKGLNEHGGTHRTKIIVPVGDLPTGNYQIRLVIKYMVEGVETVYNMDPVWPIVNYQKCFAETDGFLADGRVVRIADDGSVTIDGKAAPASTKVMNGILYENMFEVVKVGDKLYTFSDTVALTTADGSAYTDGNNNTYTVDTEGVVSKNGEVVNGIIATVNDALVFVENAAPAIDSMPSLNIYSATVVNVAAPVVPTPVYTATFMADGEVIEVIEYPEGTDEIVEPDVPAKDGYTGAWEAYELNGNIIINAVYTSTETEPEVSETEPEVSETEPEVSETEPAASESQSESASTPATSEPAEEESGCASVIGFSAAAVVLAAAAAAVTLKKKED